MSFFSRSGLFFLVPVLLLFSSCAVELPVERGPEVLAPSDLPRTQASADNRVAVNPAFDNKNNKIDTPDFVPATEELSPLKARVVSISIRDTPLRDVLYIITDTTDLNLVIEKGVNADTPVTISLQNVTAESALETLLSSVDYFYELKDNILIVKAMETRMFEFGRPSITQSYSASIGGSVSGGTGSASHSISADVENLWDSIQTSMTDILASSQAAGAQASFSISKATGTIMVTATKKDLERVEAYLDRVKEVLDRQVMVEARIIEVSLSDSFQFGIDWKNLGNDIKGLGKISLQTAGFAPTTTTNFSIGVTGQDFTGILNMVKEQGDINVLSNPRINIMNGQTALLSVGRQTDFISQVTTTTDQTTNATTFTATTDTLLSGVVFGIAPFISGGKDKEISMTITPLISDVIKLEDKTIGSVGQDTIQMTLPTVDIREMTTTIKVKSGETIIIGGLIQEKEEKDESKVPLFGDLPLVGGLFTRTTKKKEKTELIIMLRPVVM